MIYQKKKKKNSSIAQERVSGLSMSQKVQQTWSES